MIIERLKNEIGDQRFDTITNNVHDIRLAIAASAACTHRWAKLKKKHTT